MRKLITRAVLALIVLVGLSATATAPVEAHPPGTGPKSVFDDDHVWTFTASYGIVDVGETFTLTMRYKNKGAPTLTSGFGFTGATVGTFVIGPPSGDTVGCSTLLTEAGCTWLAVPANGTMEVSWPVTVLSRPPGDRLTFSWLLPGEPQETRAVGVTLYNLDPLTVDVR